MKTPYKTVTREIWIKKKGSFFSLLTILLFGGVIIHQTGVLPKPEYFSSKFHIDAWSLGDSLICVHGGLLSICLCLAIYFLIVEKKTKYVEETKTIDTDHIRF
jgi:hypothetical protein